MAAPSVAGLHAFRPKAYDKNPVGWANQLSYDSIGVRLLRRIQMDRQTAEDQHVIVYLRQTVR